MRIQSPLRTARLLLRQFTEDDEPQVARLAGEWDIARYTLNIPHPYTRQDARAWILSHERGIAAGTDLPLAITLRDEGTLVGAVGLRKDLVHFHAELGYWIGKPYWGNGYATEAATAVLGYGFREMELHRIYARHMATNPASGRVLQKIGMTREGELRQHLFKWDHFEDAIVYGILEADYHRRHPEPPTEEKS